MRAPRTRPPAQIHRAGALSVRATDGGRPAGLPALPGAQHRVSAQVCSHEALAVPGCRIVLAVRPDHRNQSSDQAPLQALPLSQARTGTQRQGTTRQAPEGRCAMNCPQCGAEGFQMRGDAMLCSQCLLIVAGGGGDASAVTLAAGGSTGEEPLVTHVRRPEDQQAFCGICVLMESISLKHWQIAASYDVDIVLAGTGRVPVDRADAIRDGVTKLPHPVCPRCAAAARGARA